MARTRRLTALRLLLATGLITAGFEFFAAKPALAAPPTIGSFDPACGPAGTAVTITGSGFNDAPIPVSAVTFNNVAATFTVDSNTQISTTVPAGATTGPIRVTDAEGTATSAADFSVTTSTTPSVTSFTPNERRAGYRCDRHRHVFHRSHGGQVRRRLGDDVHGDL